MLCRMTTQPTPAVQPHWKQWLGPACIAAAGIITAWWSWLTWCDPIVDFGRELYLPWQISEGRVLYRDLYSTFGPLSPHFNALLFKVFGVGLHTLVYANLLILALSTAMLYRLLLRIADRLAATVGGLCLVVLFGFCQYLTTGNYNWICPYSHELTHGAALSLAAMLAFCRFIDTRRTAWLITTGLVTGLVFLTKPEIFVALVGALTIALISVVRTKAIGRQFAIAIGATLAAPLLCVLLLSAVLPFDAALRGAAGMWLYMFDTRITLGHHFYKIGAGIDDVAGHSRQLVLMALAIIALLTPGYFIARRASRRLSWQIVGAIAASAVVVLAIVALHRNRLIDWENIARPLPLFTLIPTILLTVKAFRTGDRTAVAAMMQCWFALLLLAKMILNSRIHGYGFVQAMPAFAVLVVSVTYWLPRRIDRYGLRGLPFVAPALTMLVCFAWVYLSISNAQIEKKTQWLATGRDTFRSDGRAESFNMVISRIQQNSTAEATLVVFPEGAMFNYLARRRSSVPYILYIPHQVDIVGEANLLAALQANPPDLIIIIARNLDEYGVATFGIEYARRLWDWVRRDYGKHVLQVDHGPMRKRLFGMWVFVRGGSTPR